MFALLAPMILATSLGQSAPAETAWLKAIPADVAVVARVKALETSRDDLLKMIEAMSPNAAALVQPQIEQAITILSAQYGKTAVQSPMMIVAKLPTDGAIPPWAVLIQATDYMGVLKAVSSMPELETKSLGGYDVFETSSGQTWYGAKGNGYVAFGGDEALIKSITKPAASLDEAIAGDHKTRLLGGDLGFYVNVAALQAQYGDQIDQAEQTFLGAIDQAGGQLTPSVAKSVKSMYSSAFDAIKEGEALSFNFDFAAEGLNVATFVSVKPDSAAAKNMGTTAPGPGALLAKLPADASSFTYFKVSDQAFVKLQKFGMSFLGGDGGPNPALEKAMALQLESGTNELFTANTISGNSMGNFSISTPRNPAKAVEAARLTSEALKAGGGLFKDVVINPKTQNYAGFVLTEAKTTLDLDKLVAPGAPGGIDGIKKMMGGDTITSWYGTDGTTVLNLSAKSFEEAKPLIDAAKSGKGSIGESANYVAIRKKLPANTNALFLFSAQGIIKQVANQIGSTTGNEIKIPADVPKDPALLGGSMTSTPKGISLQFTVPSNVGPVLERGLVPVIQSMQGQIQ